MPYSPTPLPGFKNLEQAIQDLPRDTASISRIVVKKLFGRYSYEIIPRGLDNEHWSSRLVLLYGENASGKTTILNLLYHLLSPVRNGGHRTYIATVEFESFEVSLNNGITIRAEREEDSLTGSYTIAIEAPGAATEKWELVLDHDNIIDTRSQHIDRLSEVLYKIAMNPYFLTESREFKSDELDNSIESARLIRAKRNRMAHSSPSFLTIDNTEVEDALSTLDAHRLQQLNLALQRVGRWFQIQALHGTNQGLASANNVYAEVLEGLLVQSQSAKTHKDDQETGVGERLNKLAARAAEYDKFGLWMQFPAARFTHLLNRAVTPEMRRNLELLLEPHIDISEAQLEALSSVFELISVFTESINSLFVDKRISFRATSRGIAIETTETPPRPLDPSSLSSGEKHLLLLLCNTLIARERTGVFLIDEPEISLNATWQRKIIDILLACTKGTNIQFIVATHSIEILSRYRDSISRLEMTNNEG